MAKRPAHSCDNLQCFTRFQRSTCDMAMTFRCQGWDDGSAKLDLRSKTKKNVLNKESDHQFDMFCFLQDCPFSVYVWFSPDLSGHIQSFFDNTNLRTLRNLQDLLIDLNCHIITFHHPFRIWGFAPLMWKVQKLSSLTCRKAGCLLSRWRVVTTSKFPVTHLAIAKFDDLKNVSETDGACSWNFTCYWFEHHTTRRFEGIFHYINRTTFHIFHWSCSTKVTHQLHGFMASLM